MTAVFHALVYSLWGKNAEKNKQKPLPLWSLIIWSDFLNNT